MISNNNNNECVNDEEKTGNEAKKAIDIRSNEENRLQGELRWQEELREAVKSLINAAGEKKANDIIAVHVGDKTIVADWFVFMSGTSSIHVKSLCDELEDKAAELGFVLKRREGYNEGRWIVLDLSSVLVHIFHPEEREYYNVERLWIDPTTEILRYEDK